MGIHKGHIYKRLEPLEPLYNTEKKVAVRQNSTEIEVREQNIEETKGPPDHCETDRIPKFFALDQIPILAEHEKTKNRTPKKSSVPPILRAKRIRRAPNRLQF